MVLHAISNHKVTIFLATQPEAQCCSLEQKVVNIHETSHSKGGKFAMTRNQIEWFKLKEQRRSNLENEAIGRITASANASRTVYEHGDRNRSMSEAERHNQEVEKQALAQLGISQYMAEVSNRQADASLINASANTKQAQASLINADANSRNADTNAKNAEINQQNADTNARNAHTNYLNYTVNSKAQLDTALNNYRRYLNEVERNRIDRISAEANAEYQKAKAAYTKLEEAKMALEAGYWRFDNARTQINGWLGVINNTIKTFNNITGIGKSIMSSIYGTE